MAGAQRRRRVVRPESGQQLAPGQRRRVLAELVRRRSARRSVDFRELCFPRQLQFVDDPAPLVAASCSRRAGKSWGIAYKMLHVAQQHPHSQILYLSNTKPQAKRILWKVLQKLDDQLGLRGKFNAVSLTYRLRNDAQIEFGGCNDGYEIERYRGPSYPLVVIDEAQSIRSFLKSLILEILRPATLDYHGQIIMAGTPNSACMGYLHDAVKGTEKGWSVHNWTLLDNPTLPDPVGWLAEHRALVGCTEDDPKYRREYCGEWVRDSSSQVYQITDKNLVAAFPEEWADDWEFVLGVDLGFVHVSAFVVLAFSVRLGKIVVLESHTVTPAKFGPEEKLLTPDMLASEIEALRGRYDFAGIVVDPGGLGATFITEVRRRFGIPAVAADKKAKLGAIELLNGDLRTGRVLVVEPRNADLLHDARMLEWRWDRVDEESRKRGTVPRAELLIDDRATPDHLTDALTYGYRRCRAYFHDPADRHLAPPKAGTPEWEAWREEERERRELGESDEQARPWWACDPSEGGFSAEMM